MVEILQNKNSATRFQIMVEIAASGARVKQRNIAAKLRISPQAISDYIHQMANEKLIEATDRYHYRVSPKGVDWMLKMLRELNDYTAQASRAVTNITVCAALAENDLVRGQPVGLKMKNGLLFATDKHERGAKGIAVTDAKQGEDVGVSDIEGLVELTRGKVTILEVPSIQEGGSRQVDLAKLKAQLNQQRQIGAIGIEALAALRRAGIEPSYLFGVAEAAIEEAMCGLSSVIVCTSDATSGLIRQLQENGLGCKIINLAARTNSP